MITAEGIVGKIVTLIVSKTVGKLIDLPFDKRKKHVDRSQNSIIVSKYWMT